MDAGERRRLATEAAATVARTCGLANLDPIIIHDSNNTLLHLRPYPIVAKVGTSPLAGRTGGLVRELRLLEFLADAQVPAVRPTTLVPAGPYEASGLRVIMLAHVAAVGDEVSADARAQALDAVHTALARFPDELPGFLESFVDTAAVVADRALTPTLTAADREFLVHGHEELLGRVPPLTGIPQALHGDPWIGNMITTAEGPLLLDFEAACYGPLEWDWSPLPAAVAERSRADLDSDLLRVFRVLRSLMVTTWCWSQPGRAPEVDEAAAWHLAVLRQKLQ